METLITEFTKKLSFVFTAYLKSGWFETKDNTEGFRVRVLNHNRSTWVLDPNETVCRNHSSLQSV